MYALIHQNQLILGPIHWNYRMINSELEELELEERVSSNSFSNVPFHFSQDTHIIPAVNNILPYDERFQYLTSPEWEIIGENGIPIRVEFTHQIQDKTLEQVKQEYKTLVAPERRNKEVANLTLNLYQTDITVSTSRENRLSLISKMMSNDGPYNFKFDNDTWIEITKNDLQYVISQIDLKVQEAFDWEYNKLQEIDACVTKEDVYNVIIRVPENTLI